MLEEIEKIIEKIGQTNFTYNNGISGYCNWESFTYEGQLFLQEFKLKIKKSIQGGWTWFNISCKVKEGNGWIELMSDKSVNSRERNRDSDTCTVSKKIFEDIKNQQQLNKEQVKENFLKLFK